MSASDCGARRKPERCAVPGAYAGIGSRKTPPAALTLIELLAARLARRGCILRTGASPGADQAFYRGARAAAGPIELYLPWPGFEGGSWADADRGHVRVLARPAPRAYDLAARFQAGWEVLAQEQRDLMARDAHQVLGADLASPAKLVVCWTADGSLDGTGVAAEGTHEGLRIAHEHGIRVFNLARPDHARRLAQAQPDGCVCS
jgi:hypothetical protein